MDYQDLDIEELEQQLQQLREQEKEIEAILIQKQREMQRQVAQEIKEDIIRRGYDVKDILQIFPRVRRSGAKKRTRKVTKRQYTTYVDPDNPDNTYSRGVLPGWMRQKMQDQGYDPASKEDREAFKKNCLQALETVLES